MVRKNISITEKQNEWLRYQAYKQEKSETEVIRGLLEKERLRDKK